MEVIRRPGLTRSVCDERSARHAAKGRWLFAGISILEVCEQFPSPYPIPISYPHSVLFRYENFTVSYESGIDNIPRFDAHIEVYGATKSVKVQYDTPYVKGLPVTLHIAENVDGAHKETMVRKSYEDPYTQEMKKLWEMVVEGRAVKTTAQDALQDLEVFSMAMKHFYSS